jgi:CelD/BcsL family acetyltransferase involved in cellulose biosynthesis
MTLPFKLDLLAEPYAVPACDPVPLDTVIEPADHWSRVAPHWAELAESSHGSIFVMPVWIETWLETFGDLVDASVLLFKSETCPVGACLLVKSRRSLLRPLRRLSLNASGEPEADTLHVEFNDLVCRPGWVPSFARLLAGYLIRQPWDQFRADGFCEGPGYDSLKQELACFATEERWQPSYYVDLAALRSAGLTYPQALPSDRRKGLLQRLRYQARAGSLRLEPAKNVEQALLMLDRLAALNTRRFGPRGIWTSSRFRAFHRSFIRKTFDLGNVQLLQVTAGQQLVGLLYNLVHRGKVYFYQCGYNYTADRRLSPGVVTLALAVEYSRESGLDEFDFLAGDGFEKRWMSTRSRRLVWATFSRPGPRLWMYARLGALKRMITQ